MNDFRAEIEATIDALGSKMRVAATQAVKVAMPALVLLTLHFAGYVLFFGTDTIQLLDVGAVARFSFAAFLLIGVSFYVSRFLFSVIYGTVGEAFPFNSLVELSGKFAYSKLRILFPDENPNLDEIGVQFLGYGIGFIAFSLFYLGSIRALVIITLVMTFVLIILVALLFRSVRKRTSLRREIKELNSFGLIALTIGVLATVSGNVRASYVASSKNYFISRDGGFSNCEIRTEELSEDVFIEGVVFLSSASAILVYKKDTREVLFLPYEIGYQVCVDRSRNVQIDLLLRL